MKAEIILTSNFIPQDDNLWYIRKYTQDNQSLTWFCVIANTTKGSVCYRDEEYLVLFLPPKSEEEKRYFKLFLKQLSPGDLLSTKNGLYLYKSYLDIDELYNTYENYSSEDLNLIKSYIGSKLKLL